MFNFNYEGLRVLAYFTGKGYKFLSYSSSGSGAITSYIARKRAGGKVYGYYDYQAGGYKEEATA